MRKLVKLALRVRSERMSEPPAKSNFAAPANGSFADWTRHMGSGAKQACGVHRRGRGP